MPIYEYKCNQCGRISEFRITSQYQVNSLRCRDCGSPQLDRIISAPAISTSRSTEGNYSSGQTCCGRDHGCSSPGSCCGH